MRKLVAAAIISLFTIAYAQAGQTGCGAHYAAGNAPEIANPALGKSLREVCFSSFGVFHSGLTKTALWSAEHLLRENVYDAKELVRENTFHAERSLPASERSELSDYEGSGFDRGHLAPNADMPTKEAQHESFSLSNMIPQNPNNNRHLWKNIEIATRNYAKKQGEIYVITGPLFVGNQVQQLNRRVLVPTHIYKIVYDPKQGAAAYLVENKATDAYQIVPVSEIERLAGINFFPTMPQNVKQHAIRLFEPRQDAAAGVEEPSHHGSNDLGKAVGKALKHMLR